MGTTNVYRVGHKGNIDLKYLRPSSGGYYYKDHMPVLGKPEEQQSFITYVKPSICVGDRVKVCLEIDALMKIQQGHGGWNPRMVDHLPKLGTVHRITDKGDIRVQYDSCSNRWTFHPAALVKIITFRVGDLVTIIKDEFKLRQLQKGHGEWIELMRYALGKHCRIIKVYSDGDLRIQQLDDGFEWTLNPKCVKLERSPLDTVTERSNSMMDLSHRRSDHIIAPLSGLSGSSEVDKLVRESAVGCLDYVKKYLEINPSEVNVLSGGKSCIQVAAYQGFNEIVQYLLSKGANVNIVDSEGDSALHYAAFGNQAETMRILLQNGADINFLNSSHCSVLHICAHKKTPDCLRELLQFKPDVNLQDSYGDTALHDAIGKENAEVVELLCEAPNLDFNLKNKRGFNVLHHASLKGNSFAAKLIIQLSRQLVDVKKDDGFAALHLAALNGHTKVVEVLVVDGQADIDIRNNRQQTPLLLAVSQGHSIVIEKLITLGCEINAKDEDGDNAMHLCIIKKSNLLQTDALNISPEMQSIYSKLSDLTENRLMYTIICYLALKGCKIEHNNKGATIFKWITEKSLKQMILEYQRSSKSLFILSDNFSSNKCKAQSTQNKQGSNVEKSQVSRPVRITNATNNIIPITNLQDTDISTYFDAYQRNNLVLSENPFNSASPSEILPEKVGSIKELNSDHPIQNSSLKNYKGLLEMSQRLKTSETSSPENADLKFSNADHSNDDEGASCLLAISCKFKSDPQECVVCDEILPLIKFEPCQHQISCEICGGRMKKCLRCGSIIERRIAETSHIVNSSQQNRVSSADRLRYLENKIQEYEESHYCSICMERTRDVAFLCGHGACSRCAETLRTCHMCRKTILKKINLY